MGNFDSLHAQLAVGFEHDALVQDLYAVLASLLLRQGAWIYMRKELSDRRP